MKKVYATSGVRCSTDKGSLAKFINQVEDKIDELQSEVEMSTDLDSSCVKGELDDEIEECNGYADDAIFGEEIDYAYAIEDSYGAPQAGVDVQKFETYNDLELYLEAHPDVADRISEGYAIIKEL